MGIHDGHRERMRQRYDQMGADGFHDHEMLEMLLSCALPRVDTNPIAHRLIERYGFMYTARSMASAMRPGSLCRRSPASAPMPPLCCGSFPACAGCTIPSRRPM